MDCFTVWYSSSTMCRHTGGVGRQESSCSDAIVCTQFDKELVARRVDDAGLLSATQPGQLWSSAAVTVVHLKRTQKKPKEMGFESCSLSVLGV